MIRALVVAGAIALALLPPAVTLGAPVPVFRGAPIPHPLPRAAEGRSAGQDTFKVPIEINVRQKSVEPDFESTFAQYRWHGWQWSPRYFWYQPAWYQNGCFANNLFGTPTNPAGDSSWPANVTIGSLVDNRSMSLFSSTPSYNPSNPNTANLQSNGTLSATLQPTLCGSSSSFNF